LWKSLKNLAFYLISWENLFHSKYQSSILWPKIFSFWIWWMFCFGNLKCLNDESERLGRIFVFYFHYSINSPKWDWMIEWNQLKNLKICPCHFCHADNKLHFFQEIKFGSIKNLDNFLFYLLEPFLDIRKKQILVN
jgi:hypothetical protein